MLSSYPSRPSADFPNYSAGSNDQGSHKRKLPDAEPYQSQSSSANVRRRISRACDQCNQQRTKCDGKQPCTHCKDFKLPCEYARVHKKRGRVSKATAQGAETSVTPEGDQSENQKSTDGLIYTGNALFPSQQAGKNQVSRDGGMDQDLQRRISGVSDTNSAPFHYPIDAHAVQSTGTIADFVDHEPQNIHFYHYGEDGTGQLVMDGSEELTGRVSAHLPFDINDLTQELGFPLGGDYSVAFMGKTPMVESPDWLALSSPNFLKMVSNFRPRGSQDDSLKYPVLLPLLPHLGSIIPQYLASDLLEQYFASSTSVHLRPANPYILGYVFRKQSMLDTSKPRFRSPALLASMLWTAAQTSDAAFLTSQPDTRSKVCQKLLELIINLLKPLVHNHSTIIPSDSTAKRSSDDAMFGVLGVSTTQTPSDAPDQGQLDSIITYIHLATVVSASERKAASLRYWNAAWCLAREVRLGRELPANPQETEENTTSSHGVDNRQQHLLASFTDEEEREERRRVWWLLYMMDRHLALCYNRPMFFLNKECESLLQPMDDDAWQAGNFEQGPSGMRRRGLDVTCNAQSVFGYFLPLMVILGEILDLNHARNRPRIGPSVHRIQNWDEQTQDITKQLDAYAESLRTYETEQSTAMSAGVTASPALSESTLQTKTVVAYGTHIMHVLHILLTGKWDPIALMDDKDLWISSQSFVTATGHAVSAAEAVSNIIEFDPDLGFMPFFFGVYLLQGSFLLLLFAEKLQSQVSPEVVKACETIVRAHEACVATLDTQYQRNFRKVMRSTLQQVRGRMPGDVAEQQHWRREVLALYRWTGDGTGLAL